MPIATTWRYHRQSHRLPRMQQWNLQEEHASLRAPFVDPGSVNSRVRETRMSNATNSLVWVESMRSDVTAPAGLHP